MRCPTLPLLALAALSLAACTDDPTAPADVGPAVSAPRAPAALVTTPACTKRWKTGVSGDWSVGTNWIPTGVPRRLATVCLDAAGTYTVTLSNPDTVDFLVVGGAGANPTLTVSATTANAPWSMTGGLYVKSGGTVSMTTALSVTAAWVVNEGSLVAAYPGRSGYIGADSIVNLGYLEAQRDTLDLYPAQYFRNAGTLQVTGAEGRLRQYAVEAVDFRMEGGTVLGAGAVEFWPIVPPLMYPPPTQPYIVPRFVWTGGDLPARLGTTTARVRVQGVSIDVLDSTLTGTIELDLYQLASWYHPYDQPWVGAPAGGLPAGVRVNVIGAGLVHLPSDSRGTLSVTPQDTAATDVVTVEFSGGSLAVVHNSGTLLVNAGTGTLSLKLDSLVNTGTVTFAGPASLPWLSNVENAGTITVAAGQTLSLGSADFQADSGSVQSGLLGLSGGTLSGTGQVGGVLSAGGTIAPGPVSSIPVLPGVGTLSATGLYLDPASTVVIDLTGSAAGRHDLLAVSGLVVYGGTLRVLPGPLYLGGHCGEVIPVITDGSGTLNRGSFATVTGLVPAPSRAWRTYNPSGALELVGYSPLAPVSVYRSSLTVTEGGAGASYDVCLRSAPTATVDVTPASAGGQLAALAPVSFTTAAWALPLSVPVSAVDDALLEPPPQTATITHTVSSTDPAYSGATPASVTVTIIDNDGSANLELHVFSAAPVVAVGDTFTVTLQNENLGPDDSPGATFTIPASAGFTYAANTGTLGCSYDAVTGTSCQLPSLVNGGKTDFTVTLVAVAAGSYSTTFSLSSIQADSNLLNNARVQLITIN